YSRQRANFSDLFSLSVKPGQLGEGVQVVDITRLRSAYLDASTRQEIGQQSMYQQVNQDLQNLESVFGSPTNPKLNQGLNAFFNSFQDLSAHPHDISTRQAVSSGGTALAPYFQDANAQIAQLRNGLDSQVNETATSINSILGQVATL